MDMRMAGLSPGHLHFRCVPSMASGGHVVAAVDVQAGAGDEAGRIGGKEHHGARDLLGLPEPADRDLRNDLGIEHFLGHGGNHLGGDLARRDGVDGDAFGGTFERQRLGETVHAGLGGRVVRLSHLPLAAVDGRDVDDAAEVACTHAVDHLARRVEDAVEIDADDLFPLLERHTVQHGVARDAGVVDQDLDRPEFGLDLLDARAAGLKGRHVPFEDRNAGLGLEFLRRLVVAGLLAGFGAATKLTAALMIIALATAIVLVGRGPWRWRERVETALLFALGAALVVAPWLFLVTVPIAALYVPLLVTTRWLSGLSMQRRVETMLDRIEGDASLPAAHRRP